MHLDQPYAPLSKAELDTMIEWLDEVDLAEQVVDRPLLVEGRRKKPIQTPEQLRAAFKVLTPDDQAAARRESFPRKPAGAERRLQGPQRGLDPNDLIRERLRAASKDIEKAEGIFRSKGKKAVSELQNEVAVLVNAAGGEGRITKEQAQSLFRAASKGVKAGDACAAQVGDARESVKLIAANMNPPWIGPTGRRTREFMAMTGAAPASVKYGSRVRGADKAARDQELKQRPAGAILESISGMVTVLEPSELADEAGHLGLEAEQIADEADVAINQGKQPNTKKLADYVKRFLEFRDKVDFEFVKYLRAIEKRAKILMDRFKGKVDTVQLEDRDELSSVISDLSRLMTEGPYNPQVGNPTMLKLSRSNVGRRSVRGQLESVAHLLEALPTYFDFDEVALEPVAELYEQLLENPSDRNAAFGLAELLIQLTQELDEERENPIYPPKVRRDMVGYANMAAGIAHALEDAYSDDEAQLHLEHQELLTERRKVGFMDSSDKRKVYKRARLRIEAIKQLLDRSVEELGGGAKAAATAKDLLDKSLKEFRAGSNSLKNTIAKAQSKTTAVMRKAGVDIEIRRTVNAFFYELRSELGVPAGKKPPAEWTMAQATARSGVGLDFWELGPEPEAPLEKPTIRKTGSINKVLKDLGKTLSVPGMSKGKVRDLLADPFGVA